MSNDKSNHDVSNYFHQTQKVTAEACGVSFSTVKRKTTEGIKSAETSDLVQEVIPLNTSPTFTSPRKTYKWIKYANGIDDFDAEIVRKTVHEFYDNHEYPTSLKLLSKYRKKTDFNDSKISMWRILKSLHFKYKKCNDGRKFLTEKNDIVCMRVKFLRKMCILRQNNDLRPVIYLDETLVNQNHTRGYIW